MAGITIKEALDILDEKDRRQAFRHKTRYSRDPTKETFGFDRASYEEDYFKRKRVKSEMQARN